MRLKEGTEQLERSQRRDLLLSVLACEAGATVTVALRARKATDTTPRIAGSDYVDVGLPRDLHIGQLSVHRYVDSAENRRKDRVGRIYLKIRSVLRADGLTPYGWVNVRIEEITSFSILGVEEPEAPPEEISPIEAVARDAGE